MSERWRDKKGEPGFDFHAWMRTVDELEDMISGLIEALKEADLQLQYLDERWPTGTTPTVRIRINVALAKVEEQS